MGLQPAFNFARLLDKYNKVKVAGAPKNVFIKPACYYFDLQEAATGHTVVGAKKVNTFPSPSKFFEAGLKILTEKLTGENHSFNTRVGDSHRPENSRDTEPTVRVYTLRVYMTLWTKEKMRGEWGIRVQK